MLSRDAITQARAAEAAENAASIRAIPHDELSDDGARAALIALALRGLEVYAYRPACSLTYVLWMRPERADMDGRHIPAEWAAHWRAQIGGNAGA